MGDSYSRRCKYCGKWINLRKMPHGQWVAFEGLDTIHECSHNYHEYSYSNPKSRQSFTRISNNSNREKSGSSNSCINAIVIIVIIIVFFSCISSF